MEVSINGGYPKMVGFKGNIPLKWIIWGYPYFRKPPYGKIWQMCHFQRKMSAGFFFRGRCSPNCHDKSDMTKAKSCENCDEPSLPPQKKI